MKNPEYFKQKLLTERKTIIKDLRDVGVERKDVEDAWDATPEDTDIMRSDSNEVGDKIESYEGNLAIVNELDARLREIDAALEKIKLGTYGMCEVDNKPIEEERLEANPSARTCKAHINM